jgi:choline dehydrogenase-like flavoprotein
MNADVVVVGSGPSGAVAAAMLVAKGLRVVMLDAGVRAPAGALLRVRGNTLAKFVRGGPETDRHVAAGDPGTEWFSSLTHGGLSNFWTAAVPRFHPNDFTEGDALDARYRWPVTYDELEPFYASVERMMKITAGDAQLDLPANVRTYYRRQPEAWLNFAARVAQAGHSVGTLPMANGAPTALLARSTGWNSYHCMVKPLLGASNFSLLRGAQVVRLVWSGSESRVVAVEYIDHMNGGATTLLPCRAVVVAAGALDSTRILLQSRSKDFPDGLGNDTDVVGRYLHDHPRQWWLARLDRALPILAHPMYVARAGYGVDAPLMANSLTIGLAEKITRVRTWYGASSSVVGVQVFGTMVPQPHHRVTVPRAADGSDDTRSRLTLDVAYDAQALQNMVAARDRFVEVFRAAGIAAEPLAPFDPMSPGSSVHYAGTVRMHDDPTVGVLDRWNRVHAAPNVLVTDMSCFTTSPEKNPTLTAMALSARAAERLARDLSSQSPPALREATPLAAQARSR